MRLILVLRIDAADETCKSTFALFGQLSTRELDLIDAPQGLLPLLSFGACLKSALGSLAHAFRP